MTPATIGLCSAVAIAIAPPIEKPINPTRVMPRDPKKSQRGEQVAAFKVDERGKLAIACAVSRKSNRSVLYPRRERAAHRSSQASIAGITVHGRACLSDSGTEPYQPRSVSPSRDANEIGSYSSA